MNENEEPLKKASKPIAVSVPLDMSEWLEKNPQINRSKIFQEAVVNLMNPVQKKVSSQIVLMMFMNFIISMAIIFVSVWMPTQIANQDTQYLKLILIFLALILTIVSLMTYKSEKSRVVKHK